jgi:hypothetical protein
LFRPNWSWSRRSLSSAWSSALSEVSLNINNELEDVGSAFSSVQQSYNTSGTCGHKGHFSGSSFCDTADFCDGQNDIR